MQRSDFATLRPFGRMTHAHAHGPRMGLCSPMPTVTVRYFAALREARGAEHECIEIAAGTTSEQLYRQLFSGRLAELPVGHAINASYAAPSTVLDDGDEVVFLPPLGGG